MRTGRTRVRLAMFALSIAIGLLLLMAVGLLVSPPVTVADPTAGLTGATLAWLVFAVALLTTVLLAIVTWLVRTRVRS